MPGLAALVLAYVLSQFFRAFLAVLAPDLGADLGITAAELSRASGIWFLVFAAMQVPIGAALDRIGPRLTSAVLLALGGAGGAALFAVADARWQIDLAMGLIGAGCAPVLMASYYIFARTYSPAVFATLAGALIGVGSLGNLGASVPLEAAVGAFGWRGTMWALAGVTLAVAAACLLVRDPPPVEGGAGGSVLDLLRIPAMWAILPMMLVNYAPSAGLRGLWAGPYAIDLLGVAAGTATLAMGLAMIAGNFGYGPLDRVFGTRKWVVWGGNALGAAACAALWLTPAPGAWTGVALLCVVGALGASFPVMVAHGRAFFPPHLVGRGVTLMNLFGIGGVGVMQFATGPLFEAAGGGVEGYRALFGAFAVALALGVVVYSFAPDRTD